MSYTKKIDKQASNVSYKGTWENLGGGTQSGSGLEDASNTYCAFGTFGNIFGNGKPIVNQIGNNAVVLRNGTEFQYNKRMDASLDMSDPNYDPTDGFGTLIGGVYDTGVSGNLSTSTGKVVRVVENGLNVVNLGGLALKVYAEELNETPDSIVSPPKDKIYVDPIKGRFVLPRPVYFGTFDNADGIINPTIKYGQYTPSYSNGSFSSGGKFGNCWRLYCNQWSASGYSGYIYPLSANGPILNSGTLSLWVSNSQSYGDSSTTIVIGQSTYLFISNTWQGSGVSLVVNGSTVASTSFPGSSFIHYYISWDSSGGLSASRTVRVLINNSTELLSSTKFTGYTPYINNYINCVTFYYADTRIDHVKIWNHVVNEDASWDYNGGAGMPDGLHSIYPASNGYRPILDSSSTPDSGVGYLYLLTGSGTSTISTGSSNETVELANAGSISNCTGFFGSGGAVAKSSHTKLVESTDYKFEKRLDASDIEDPIDGFNTVTGGIWDSGISGSLSSGKYIRIVQNGKNLITPKVSNGLGLKIYAKNLGKFISPSIDRCYVDPARGKFSLPGPSFWSKMNDELSISTPEIYEETPTILTNATSINKYFSTGKFGNCLYFGNALTQRYYTLFPFGQYSVEDIGTISLWQSLGAECSSEIHFGGDNNYIRINRATVSLYISGVLYQSTSTGITSPYSLSHIYIVWDRNSTIDNGKYVKVFINNSERVASLASWVRGYFFIKLLAEETAEYIKTDNLKIWRHIASPLPSWDYNSGDGYIDSMHEIYGAASNYKPILDSSSSPASGVGYYRENYDVDYVQITV